MSIPTLYFQAKESNELDNRTAFSAKVNDLIGVPYTFVYPSYSEGVDALLKYARKRILLESWEYNEVKNTPPAEIAKIFYVIV